MKTGKQIGRRLLGVVLAVLMILSCAFSTSDGIIAAAESMSTLYLHPNEGKWADNSTAPKSYSQAAGTTFTPSETPTRSGYEFIGWQLSGTGGSWNGTTFTFGSANCALNAQWRQETMYTLTVDPNGGKWADGTTSVRQYTQAPGTSCTIEIPTRDGYVFDGWYVEEYSTSGIWNGLTFTFVSSDGGVTAQWKKAQTLHIQPGYLWIQRAVSFEEMTITQAQGTTIPVPTNVYMQNKVFRGWNQPSNGTLGGNLSDNHYTVSGSGSAGELLFSRHTYTFGAAEHDGLNAIFADLPSGKAAVTVYPDGGTWQDTYGGDETRVIIQDRNTNYQLPTVVRSGYQFNGWFMVHNVGNTLSGSNVSFGNGTSAIVADWIDLAPHTLTLDPDGGVWGDTGDSQPKTVSQAYNTQYTLPTNLTKDGYVFAGWNLVAANISGNAVLHGGSLSGGVFTFGDEPRTVKPVWKELYAITVDWDDGVWLQPGMDTARSRLFTEPIVYHGYEGQTFNLGSIYVPSIAGDPLNAIQSWEYRPTWTCSRGSINESRWVYTVGSGADTIRPDWNRTSAVGAGCVFIQGGQYISLAGYGQMKGAYWADLGAEDTTYLRFMCNDPEWTNTVNGHESAFSLPELVRPGFTLSGWTIYKSRGTLVTDPANDNAGIVFEKNGTWYYVFDKTCMDRVDLCPVWSGEEEDWTYTIADRGVTITGYTGADGGVVTIPASLGGYPVTAIGSDAAGPIFLSSYDEIAIPASVTRITSDALLTGGTAAFTVDSENPAYSSEAGVLYNKDKTTLVLYPNASTYTNPDLPTSFTVPQSVTAIADNAFGQAFLETVVLPDGLTSIGEYAFLACQQLTTVNIPDSVTTIGAYAFSDCPLLGDEGLHIPSTVTSIGENAFFGCTSLRFICSEDADGVAAQCAAENGIEFRVCGSSAEPQDKISVTIGDQIGVNLMLDLDARNAQNVTVVYKDLNGVEQRETFTDFSALPQVEGGLYKIAVKIAPAQIADSVTVYIDGEQLDANVKEYCNTLIAGEFEPEVAVLAQAVLDYGQAANNFFNYTDETMSALADLSADDAKAWESQLSDTTGKIRAMSFMALTKPEFRFYMDMSESQAAACNAAGVTAAYANGNITDTLRARFVKNTHGDILLEVTGVKAEYMDETIVVTVPDIGTITFTGNDFAKMMANNAATETLGAALYAYGEAAKACFVNA